jgi:AcrR family transcriptional regulator
VAKWAGTQLSADEQKERKRKLIIRHAATMFNRRGSQGATLEEVAAQLEISKAALYRYVNSKNDLLLACHQEAVRIAMNAADRAERIGGDGWTKIRLTLQLHLEDMIDSLGVPTMLLEENSLDRKSMEMVVKLRDKYESRLRQFYREGVKDGSILPGDAKIGVFSLLGALNWTAKWYRSDRPWKSDEIAEAIVETATRGIASRPRDAFLSALHIRGVNS